MKKRRKMKICVFAAGMALILAGCRSQTDGLEPSLPSGTEELLRFLIQITFQNVSRKPRRSLNCLKRLMQISRKPLM